MILRSFFGHHFGLFHACEIVNSLPYLVKSNELVLLVRKPKKKHDIFFIFHMKEYKEDQDSRNQKDVFFFYFFSLLLIEKYHSGSFEI